MFKKVIIIAGAPRSGTSWLSQIFDSSPDTIYRHQPIFSYAFKNAINLESKKEDYIKFFKNIYNSQDEFICRTEERKKGIIKTFPKVIVPEILVFKNVRYHFLLEKMLQLFDDLKVIGIVRHPCGSVNSFLTTKELPSDADPIKEWRYAKCRNTGPEEYWGFEKWKEVAYLFLDLEKKFPNQFLLQKYSELVDHPIEKTKEIFNFFEMEYTDQTNEYLMESNTKHIDHLYATYKDKKVKDKWQWELDEKIKIEILKEVQNTILKQFL
jgi:hypothetical protein